MTQSSKMQKAGTGSTLGARWGIALSVLAITLAGWVLWQRLTPHETARKANQALDQAAALDSKGLYRSMSEAERTAIGITEEQFSALCDKVFFPPLKRGRWRPGRVLETGGRPIDQCYAMSEMTFPSGVTTGLSLNAFSTESGPQVNITRSLLILAGHAEGAAKARVWTNAEAARARLAFLDAHVQEMSALGLNGAYNDDRRILEPWIEVRRRFADSLKAASE